MLFYSDMQIRKELANILQENEALEPSYYISMTAAYKEKLSDSDRERIRTDLIDLYEKKRDLTSRLSAVMKAIDERWLGAPSGEYENEMSGLFNTAADEADDINEQANYIRKVIMNFS